MAPLAGMLAAAVRASVRSAALAAAARRRPSRALLLVRSRSEAATGAAVVTLASLPCSLLPSPEALLVLPFTSELLRMLLPQPLWL